MWPAMWRAAYSASAAWPLDMTKRSRSGSLGRPLRTPPYSEARMSATDKAEPMWPTFARLDCSRIWRRMPWAEIETRMRASLLGRHSVSENADSSHRPLGGSTDEDQVLLLEQLPCR